MDNVVFLRGGSSFPTNSGRAGHSTGLRSRAGIPVQPILNSTSSKRLHLLWTSPFAEIVSELNHIILTEAVRLVFQNNRAHVHSSKISIPKSSRPICLCPKVLRNSKQLHHQIIHFHVLEPVHYVNVVCGGVPALVLVRHPGLVVESFHDVREWTVGYEHRMHTGVLVVITVVLGVELWLKG